MSDSSGKKAWWQKSDADLIRDRYREIKEILGLKRMKVEEEDRAPLIEEARKRDPRIRNLLDQKIFKKAGIKRKGEYLIVPVYKSDWGRKMARFLRIKTRRRIRLDDYGWFVWRSINGKRDVREIGKLLRNHFGDEVEPLYPRLSKFLAYLQRLKLIEIRSTE